MLKISRERGFLRVSSHLPSQQDCYSFWWSDVVKGLFTTLLGLKVEKKHSVNINWHLTLHVVKYRYMVWMVPTVQHLKPCNLEDLTKI